MIPKSERKVPLFKKNELVRMVSVALIKHHNTKACRQGNKHRKIWLFISITSGRFGDEKRTNTHNTSHQKEAHTSTRTNTHSTSRGCDRERSSPETSGIVQRPLLLEQLLC